MKLSLCATGEIAREVTRLAAPRYGAVLARYSPEGFKRGRNAEPSPRVLTILLQA